MKVKVKSMGKSFKKTPIIKENGDSKKQMKIIANKVVRSKLKDPYFIIANGNAYKKEYESYDIADYICRWTKKDAVSAYYKNTELQEKYTLDEWLSKWKRSVVNK